MVEKVQFRLKLIFIEKEDEVVNPSFEEFSKTLNFINQVFNNYKKEIPDSEIIQLLREYNPDRDFSDYLPKFKSLFFQDSLKIISIKSYSPEIILLAQLFNPEFYLSISTLIVIENVIQFLGKKMLNWFGSLIKKHRSGKGFDEIDEVKTYHLDKILSEKLHIEFSPLMEETQEINLTPVWDTTKTLYLKSEYYDFFPPPQKKMTIKIYDKSSISKIDTFVYSQEMRRIYYNIDKIKKRLPDLQSGDSLIFERYDYNTYGIRKVRKNGRIINL